MNDEKKLKPNPKKNLKRFSFNNIFRKFNDKTNNLAKKLANTNFMKKYDKYVIPSILVLLILALIAGFIGYAGANKWDFALAAQVVFVQGLIGNFIGIPALLIGVLVLVGYKLLKRNWTETLIGTIKAIIGYLILAIGSGQLIGVARPIFLGLAAMSTSNGTITQGTSATAIVPLDPYFGQTSHEAFFGNIGDSNAGSIIFLAVIIGFFINLILVALKRFTNCRTVFVTGHIMIQQAGIMSVVIYLVLFLGNNITGQAAIWGSAILAGISIGIYWSVGSSLNYYATQKVTDNGGFAVGHQQMIGITLAYWLGKFFGKAKDDAELRKLSPRWAIFEDNIFTQTITISCLFIVLILILQFASKSDSTKFAIWDSKLNTYIINNKFAVDISGQKANLSAWNVANKSFVGINVLLGILRIVASILVIVFGVRMFVAELQQSFQGISDKLLPKASVAVDIAATFGYGQNSVTIGFISGTIAQFIAVGILIGLNQALAKIGVNYPILVPIFITLFFNSGAIGIYANKGGGIKAAIFVPFIFAIVGVLMSSIGIFAINQAFENIKQTDALKNATSALSPFSVGYNGMFDPNFFFGGLNALISINSGLAFFWIILWWIIFLVVAQFIKYNDDEKDRTWLYLKLMPKFMRLKIPKKHNVKRF